MQTRKRAATEEASIQSQIDTAVLEALRARDSKWLRGLDYLAGDLEESLEATWSFVSEARSCAFKLLEDYK